MTREDDNLAGAAVPHRLDQFARRAVGQPGSAYACGCRETGWPSAERLSHVYYADASREHLDYDSAGRVSHFSLPNGQDYYPQYDGAGNQTQLEAPNGGLQTWGWAHAQRGGAGRAAEQHDVHVQRHDAVHADGDAGRGGGADEPGR